jgi:hypothetical protein
MPKKETKKEKAEIDYAFGSDAGAGAGACPPRASLIAKPNMPLSVHVGDCCEWHFDAFRDW